MGVMTFYWELLLVLYTEKSKILVPSSHIYVVLDVASVDYTLLRRL